MSRILWAFVAACVVTISLNAQEPYPQGQGQGTAPATQAPTQAPRTPPAAPPPSASASASADKKVTYSGCIDRQPASAAAVTGAANMPFSLTNASPAAGAANAPVATSGTGAAASKTYRLDGTESTLSPHVGHKVEITGMIEEQPPSAGAGAAGSTPPAPRLKVDSVKMVSTSCP